MFEFTKKAIVWSNVIIEQKYCPILNIGYFKSDAFNKLDVNIWKVKSDRFDGIQKEMRLVYLLFDKNIHEKVPKKLYFDDQKFKFLTCIAPIKKLFGVFREDPENEQKLELLQQSKGKQIKKILMAWQEIQENKQCEYAVYELE